jgi:phage shock protein A
MSIMRRLSQVFEQRVNHALDQAEDPAQALDLSYEKQLQALQQVRRNVADVLTSEKRLEIQAAQLQQNVQRLQQQARTALAQGREDLARTALARAQVAQSQLDGLAVQIDQLRSQEQKLEVTAQKLQQKVETFRMQKDTMKAQYSAAKASTQIGEAATGLSEQIADASLMVDRSRDKIAQMQARSAAIDQLMDSGALDSLDAGRGDDIERQLQEASNAASVDQQLEAMKQQLSLPAAAGVVVRIQGEDQYRLSDQDHASLDSYDKKVMDAIEAGDEAGFKSAVAQVVEFVRAKGTKLHEGDAGRGEGDHARRSRCRRTSGLKQGCLAISGW